MEKWYIDPIAAASLFHKHKVFGIDAVKPVSGDFTSVDRNGKKVFVARYNGAMVFGDGQCTSGVSSFTDMVRRESKGYDAFLLKIDTNGGHADAAMELDGLINDLKYIGKTGVLTNNLKSAGIMATTRADFIMANGVMAELGSVGVFITLDSYFRDYYKKYVTIVQPDTSNHKNESFLEWINTGETKLMLEELKTFDKAFMALVKKNRPINSTYTDTLEGGSWMAKEAKLRGLADYIGSETDAINLLTK